MSGRTIAREKLTRLLAPALGQEKSDEVVFAAARTLGLATPIYSADEVRQIFATLSRIEGLVGVVARFAVSHGDVDGLAQELPDAERERDSVPPSTLPRSVVDLLSLLAPALGTEKAWEVLESSAARLGLDPAKFAGADDALAVLDDLGRVEGIVGVVARLAKGRLPHT